MTPCEPARRAGTAHQAVLLVTAENDPRVAPWQSRKFAATLQKANTSMRPILLITRRNQGHPVTSSFSQRVGNTGAELSFFAEELGLAPATVAPPAAPRRLVRRRPALMPRRAMPTACVHRPPGHPPRGTRN